MVVVVAITILAQAARVARAEVAPEVDTGQRYLRLEPLTLVVVVVAPVGSQTLAHRVAPAPSSSVIASNP